LVIVIFDICAACMVISSYSPWGVV